MKVTANARRSGDWWAVEVPEVEGVFTQARRLDQVAEMVADAVATMVDDIEVSDVEVEVITVLEDDLDSAIAAARELVAGAARAQREASEATRRLVRQLRQDENLSTRDVGVILGVSHQRVAQLEKSSERVS